METPTSRMNDQGEREEWDVDERGEDEPGPGEVSGEVYEH